MGKIILAILIVLALIMAMPQNLANALNMDGTYTAYYQDEDVQREKKCGLSEAKKENSTRGVMYETEAEKYGEIVSALAFKRYFSQTIDGEEIEYGYSAKVKGGIRINGRVVNVQIAMKNGVIYVGSPLLAGWY